jgi:hypothetical protein
MLAQLPPLARLGKRHRDCLFVHIQADVDDTLLHDPSPMHEARRWSIQRNLVNLHIVRRVALSQANIWSSDGL